MAASAGARPYARTPSSGARVLVPSGHYRREHVVLLAPARWSTSRSGWWRRPTQRGPTRVAVNAVAMSGDADPPVTRMSKGERRAMGRREVVSRDSAARDGNAWEVRGWAMDLDE